jgi:hypothetical protein
MSQISSNKFLVVLYKMSLSESPTLRAIVDYFPSNDNRYSDECELIIWDNSPISCEQELDAFRQSTSLEVGFVHSPQNTPLSKVYNHVSRDLKNSEYLTLFDQDSFLSAAFFTELRKAQLECWPLILPKVECNGVLISPGTRFFAKGKLLKHVMQGVIASKNLLAINSGMSVQGKVFKNITYDERLMFYGTDTYFMKQYEKYFPHAYLLDATIHHSLAENDPNVSAARKIQIEKARREAWQIVFSETWMETLFLFVYERALLVRDATRMSVKRRSND